MEQPPQLHAFDTVMRTWAAATPITNLPTKWNSLGGNSGVVSTLEGRALYFLAGEEVVHNHTMDVAFSLASVNIDTAVLSGAHPRVQRHCKAGFCDSLMALEALGDEVR